MSSTQPPATEAITDRAGEAVRVAVLLPLRLFLGITYLYAGAVKLLDPHFLVAGDPFSVVAQMEGYARSSPLGGLITATLPMATTIGLLIALAELAIGLGLLSGLAYRLAAVAGFALSILFWLVASWSVMPYFFSPDLPYAAGFLTLALAGHGGRWVLGLARPKAAPDGPAPAGAPVSTLRRDLIGVGLLAVLTGLVAGLTSAAAALGKSRPSGPVPTTAPVTAVPATPAPTTAPATAAPATAAPASAAPVTPAPPTAAPPTAAPATPAAGLAGPRIGNVADFASRQGVAITVPFEAPFALGPGNPGIMVQLPDQRVVAFSAVCTHGRCTVALDPSTGSLLCPCHLGAFDPANHATVVSGPPPLPLPEMTVAVDPATGDVHAIFG